MPTMAVYGTRGDSVITNLICVVWRLAYPVFFLRHVAQLASSPGHSHVTGIMKTWEWPGDEAIGSTILQYRTLFDVGNGITPNLCCGHRLHPYYALLSCLEFYFGQLQ